MTNDSIENLRETQLDLLRIFTETCERENFAYFAMFGTMIGAVRHGGFIPWDDDIDVAMPRSDYDKLAAMSESFKEPYFLQTPENDPGACPRFLRLMNLDTTFITPNYPNGMRRGGRMGCQIDILALDDVPGRLAAMRLASYSRKNWQQRLRRAPLEEMSFEEMPEWKQEYTKTRNPKSYTELTRLLWERCTRYKNRGTKHYTIVGSRGARYAAKLPKRHFEDYIVMQFEGIKIRVPKGHKELADIIYKDGAELPAEADRKPKHEGFFDTKNPYTKYTARYEKVFDGLQGKRILLFGAGNMLNIYMERYGEKYPPVCTFDNDPKKWGTRLCGVPVKNPVELVGMMDKNTEIIIISVHHKAIGEQIESMGVNDYRVFMDGWRYFY